MAEVAATVSRAAGASPVLGAVPPPVVQWEGVTNADTFGQVYIGDIADEISVHIKGTFDSATVSIQGGVDSASQVTLERLDGTAAEDTTEVVFSLKERPLYIKPTASGGGGSQDVDVFIAVRALR